MASLKIRVLGRGLIPRGGGIAPRKEPITADLTLIQTIMSTSGLAPFEYINPQNGKSMPLTRDNLKKIWEKYANYQVPVEEAATKEEEPKEEPTQYTCNVCKSKYSYDDGRVPAEGDELLCAACEAFKKTQRNIPKPPNVPPTTDTDLPVAPKTNSDSQTSDTPIVAKEDVKQDLTADTINEKPKENLGEKKDDDQMKVDTEIPTDSKEVKKPGDTGYTFQPRNKDDKRK